MQVMNNLFSNAARHAPASSPIRVEATCEGGYIALSVSDEGRGIPPDRLPHLFHKRRRPRRRHRARPRHLQGPRRGARRPYPRRELGDGPGRALHLHDPRWPGRPPPRQPHPRRLRPATSHARPGDGREKTPVLVVDDDPQTLRYVRDVLSDAGYAALVTGDPDGLSGVIRAEKPRLVLLDLMLPGTDGIELMKRVPELADLPVIFISGYGRDETIAKALESGAADYIVKPFSPTELVARVQGGAPEPGRARDLRARGARRRLRPAPG